jgi:glycosyltransferase involved in cell wall biosynthesis
MKKRFVTMFPQLENVHLMKDVGMIPYLIDKKFNYEGCVACYNTDSSSYDYKKIFDHLKLLKINKRFKNFLLNEIIFLINETKNIDILNIYCFSKESLIKILVYKTIRFIIRRPGTIYLKLDTDGRIKKHKINSIKSFKYIIISRILKLVDLISVESYDLAKFLNKNWPVKVEYLPNGFYDFEIRNKIDIKIKENTIITVGRIGAKQKGTDIILEAFKIIANDLPRWNLKIIGPIEKNFQPFIDHYLLDNLDIKNRIIFTGNITNKSDLENEYRRAKIFCLPSRWESFGLVLVEALSNGCRVVSSDLEAARDILNSEKYGDFFEIEDVKGLANKLLTNCREYAPTNDYCNQAQDFVYENFYWPKIVSKLKDLLENKIVSK